MNISPLNQQPTIQHAMAHARQPQQAPVEHARDNTASDGIRKSEAATRQQALVAKLMAEPDVRPQVVEANRSLANDASFPSSRELDALARALLSPVE